MKNLKRNVGRCFNVLKMNVCDTVPRCILHFFVTQLVDDLGSALEKENLVEFLQERKDIRDKRELCRKQSRALAEALPRTTNVLDKLLRMKQGSPVKGGKVYWTGTIFSLAVLRKVPYVRIFAYKLQAQLFHIDQGNGMTILIVKCCLSSIRTLTDLCKKYWSFSPKFCETVWYCYE